MKEILKGRENPNGLPLEQVLSQLIKEISVKCSYIALDETNEADIVLKNNLGIINCLREARILQQDSMIILDDICDKHDVNDQSTYRIGTPRNYKGDKYDEKD